MYTCIQRKGQMRPDAPSAATVRAVYDDARNRILFSITRAAHKWVNPCTPSVFASIATPRSFKAFVPFRISIVSPCRLTSLLTSSGKETLHFWAIAIIFEWLFCSCKINVSPCASVLMSEYNVKVDRMSFSRPKGSPPEK